MDKGKKPFTAIHKPIPTRLRTHTGACRSSPHSEGIPKNPLTRVSKGRPQTLGPHMDKPLRYSEHDQGTKRPQSPGTTKPQTPILHMVPWLLKEHNSSHPKRRDRQQQRTSLTHTTCSDVYFSTKGRQSEPDKPTTHAFLMQQRPGSPDHASHALTIRKEYVL